MPIISSKEMNEARKAMSTALTSLKDYELTGSIDPLKDKNFRKVC